jgi:hypothetical protein
MPGTCPDSQLLEECSPPEGKMKVLYAFDNAFKPTQVAAMQPAFFVEKRSDHGRENLEGDGWRRSGCYGPVRVCK